MNDAIKNILVPVDFSKESDKALNSAIEIAIENGARIILLHVMENRNHDMHSLDESRKNIKSIASEVMKRHGIKVVHKNYIGNVYDNIIRAAHLFHADLIVMGDHATTAPKSWFSESRAFKIINNSTIPVLIVDRPGDNKRKTELMNTPDGRRLK